MSKDIQIGDCLTWRLQGKRRYQNITRETRTQWVCEDHTRVRKKDLKLYVSVETVTASLITYLQKEERIERDRECELYIQCLHILHQEWCRLADKSRIAIGSGWKKIEPTIQLDKIKSRREKIQQALDVLKTIGDDQ